ncbi:acyclic terpene utilization AtuA family protein [Pseudonocardia sp. NPDC046786]|uniref:acyclic terpene utilization AtuA family protein n=1 Tax=Pseudonocardia sp. NPDC046786 TaxID=3155471 RepID=UPI0033DBDF0D
MGAANPPAAGRVVRSLLDRLSSTAPVAVVTGDDVLDRIDPDSRPWRTAGRSPHTARSCRRPPTSGRTRCCPRWTPRPWSS